MRNLFLSENNSLNEGEDLEYAYSYKYLGLEIRIGKDNQTCELEGEIDSVGSIRETGS